MIKLGMVFLLLFSKYSIAKTTDFKVPQKCKELKNRAVEEKSGDLAQKYWNCLNSELAIGRQAEKELKKIDPSKVNKKPQRKPAQSDK